MSTRDMNKAAIEEVLKERILLISENAQTYSGCPSDLINEIADALPNYPELLITALKKVLPEDVYDEWAITLIFYSLLAGIDVFQA